MKKLWIVLLLLFTAACGTEGGEEINGQTPDQVAVEWVDAVVKSDDKKKVELLTSKELEKNKEFLNEQINENKTFNNRELGPRYQLTEWKIDDNNFYYLIEFKHPVVGPHKERVSVTRTSDGWKIADFLYPKDFEVRTQSIEPRIVKEANQQ